MPRRGNHEGTVRLRADGRWEGRFSVNGRQRSLYAKTRVEVTRKMRAAQRDAEQGIPLSDERLTVERYLLQWLETAARPSVRISTYESYSSHVYQHLIPALGRIRLAKLEPQHVQALMNAKLETGLSANTVLRIRATLRRSLNQAMKWGLVSRNVATLVTPPKIEKFKVEPITPEEAAAIAAAVSQHRLSALFTLMLSAGLRLGEALGLGWQDVNLDTASLTVRRSLQRIQGEFRFVEPKSDSSRRTIPIPAFVVSGLKLHRAAQARERLQAGDAWEDSGLIFCTEKGRPLDASNVNHTFRRLSDAAGLRRMRLHDLRHGCASLLLAKGVSPRVVMETLGHSQISLTMNTYAHVIPALLREAADRMDEIFGS